VNGTITEAITNQAPFSSQWLAFTLPHLHVGGYLLSLEIDPESQVDEAAECDNIATRVLVVPAHRLHLPLTLRHSSQTALHLGSVETQASPASSAIEPVARQGQVGFLEFQMPTESSYPAQIALDSEREVLWVTERDGGKIACFDLQLENWCTPDEYTVAPNSQPWGLDIDGAGNVWFADAGLDKIGMLDVESGTISHPVTLTADSQPWGVAISGIEASTTVWFTEKEANRIGKFVPATGVLTNVVLPTPGAQPSGIDVQDTYVWFTETAANRLGRLRTAESLNVTERPIPTSNSAPHDVVIVPGGNPWLSEGQGNKIALFRADTTGWFTEIPVFTAGSEPYGIAVEVDSGVARAIWFTERNGNRLGRFTGEHSFPREYLLPTPNSRPTDIVVDGEGCAWYAAPGANRIGRFCPPPDTHTFLPLILRDESPVQGR
jgi:virginiamycin B lyase